MVSEPACNDRVVHDGLVRLIFEVAVPARAEFRAWPLVHHVKLGFCGSNLDTGFNAICCKWTSAVNVPLVEDTFLNCGIATSEVVERFDMWLRTVGGKREAVSCVSALSEEICEIYLLVILEIKTNTR